MCLEDTGQGIIIMDDQWRELIKLWIAMMRAHLDVMEETLKVCIPELKDSDRH